MECTQVIEAYTSDVNLAKDVCFAMTRAYGTVDVKVTEIRGMGWHIDCLCAGSWTLNQVKGMLGKKAHKVNWLNAG